MEEKNKLRRIIFGIIGVISLIVLLTLSGKMAETVNADEVCVIQDPADGELHVFIGGTASGGLVWQNFGTPTHYKKSNQFWFSKHSDQGDASDQSIKIRFNDGGHAQISGSVRWNMPLDDPSIIKLHTVYGSQTAIEQTLIRTTIEKCIYMTGPIMSSKESYAEKRNDLLSYIDDQATHGVYKTVTKEVKIKDELSGEEKTVSEVDIVVKDGIILRNSQSPLHEFNIQLSSGSLALNSIDYDEAVEKQIQQQQQATMSVQTAMANAKKAQQDAITVEKQGETAAMSAKWAQEKLKATAVTQAEQELAVQTLATKQAELYKQQQILEGQGEAEKQKLIMAANGALDQKLLTYERVQAKWADAFAKYQGNIVPQYQSGGGSNVNGASQFMEMMGMKAAKDLSLDLKVK